MRIFFYVGRSDGNKCGMTSTFWKIERKGKVIRKWWGPAEIRNNLKTSMGSDPVNGCSIREGRRGDSGSFC